ncbi:MAG: DNA-directed RNA polymerase subunit L [Candidatus Aenigmarchaeota archaeon]|nr:DNA-directed RNA polymerase subunit L [Candidatus Aenigmarchaeota archaeon]
MELNIVRKDDKSLLLEVKGESFTLTTPIKEKLWEDDNVIEVADMKEHPYLEEPKIWVKVEKGSPLTALSRAASKLEKDLEKLEEAFKKALKEF